MTEFMEIVYLIGYFFAILTGLALGILGGGGSMLILPIFVYLFHLEPPVAILYSLFVVGFSSLMGSFAHHKIGNVRTKVALVFGIPSVLSVVFTRKLILPTIPEDIIDFRGFVLNRETFFLLFFAAMMLFAAYHMIQNQQQKATDPMKPKVIRWGALFFEGMVVGLVTGLVGAGGGFLIIPALVYFARLDMKSAIGTSLTIISVNALIGFSSSLPDYEINWTFLFSFTAVTSLSIIIGARVSKKIKPEKLKIFFGWFILVIALFIISKELLF